jgi:signal transduction histidine kinase
LDFSTLTFYSVAGVVSFCLSALLVGYARLQPGTLLARSTALAILIVGTGFIGAGVGAHLPRWMTVIGTNMLLIAAVPVMYSGIRAYATRTAARFDTFGWTVVLLSLIPFWYWGLIEPNGHYRAAVFSLSIVLINVRSVLVLLQAGELTNRPPVRLLLGALIVLTIWMAIRAALHLFAEPAAPEMRAANPTVWTAVLGYIGVVTLLTTGVLWIEFDHRRLAEPASAPLEFRLLPKDDIRGKLLLLWSLVIVLITGVVGALGVDFAATHQAEKRRLLQEAELANSAFIEFTRQTVEQADTLLRATRAFYRRSGSLTQTEAFVAGLGFRQALFDNVYLIDADGLIRFPEAAGLLGRSVIDREYFRFHRENTADALFLDKVQIGQITGKKQFRVTRRIETVDGGFGGVVVVPIEPAVFANYYQHFVTHRDGIATLVGIDDRRIRARYPEPATTGWDQQVSSPLWDLLRDTPAGSYRSPGRVDGIERELVYRQVDDLPLVMVTGFSDGDIVRSAVQRVRLPAVIVGVAVIVVILFAALLTIEVRRRDEQERFLSMLNHELKTPLAVIRMTLGATEITPAGRERVARAVADMNAIVERCLLADQLGGGKVAQARSPCAAETLLQQARQQSVAPDRVRIEPLGQLPMILTDNRLVSIVLGNLIDNALKYGAPGSAVDVVADSTPSAGRPGLRFIVGNLRGAAGMPDAGRVFEKFYRAAGAHGKSGSGLGLFISAGIARQLGGTLRYVPEGERVKFELWLPL